MSECVFVCKHNSGWFLAPMNFLNHCCYIWTISCLCRFYVYNSRWIGSGFLSLSLFFNIAPFIYFSLRFWITELSVLYVLRSFYMCWINLTARQIKCSNDPAWPLCNGKCRMLLNFHTSSLHFVIDTDEFRSFSFIAHKRIIWFTDDY